MKHVHPSYAHVVLQVSFTWGQGLSQNFLPMHSVCPVVRAELKDCPIILAPGPIQSALFIIIKIRKISPKIEIVNYKFKNEVILKVFNARSERKKLEKNHQIFIFYFSCETKNYILMNSLVQTNQLTSS
jgi:hypothetical protein